MATEDTVATEDKLKNKDKKGTAVIGYALYFFGYSTWNGKLVYLEDLYVTHEHRGKHLFTCLETLHGMAIWCT